jgi:hypothetical protein
MSESFVASLTHDLRIANMKIRDLEAVRYPTPAQERMLFAQRAHKERLEIAIELERGQVDLFPEAS